MKTPKTAGLVLLMALLCSLFSACQTPGATHASTPANVEELSDVAWLRMVMRYLYRWQLDESEFEAMLNHNKLVFWIRPLQLKLDPGDHSQFAEILLPQLKMTLLLKKADYRITETGPPVKSKEFKIIRVSSGEVPNRRLRESTVVTMDTDELRDFLFTTRHQRDTFDPVIVQNLRRVAEENAANEQLSATNILGGQQLIAIAPRAPVANETWILWEIRRKLFHISSDIDLSDPEVWKHQTLKVRVIDLDKQVVISHEAITGSNFYITRHQISRVLYNCIILGQRIDIPRPTPTPTK